MPATESKEIIDYNMVCSAHHEAAHTIVALYNFLFITDVDIVATDDLYGLTEWFEYTHINITDDRLRKKALYCKLQVYYSGGIGERMFYKEICGSDKFPLYIKSGASDDTKTASQTIRNNNLSAPGLPTTRFKNEIKKQTKNILIEFWDDVVLIAHALYKNIKLDFDDIKKILTKKSRNSKFWRARFRAIRKIYNETNPISEIELARIIKL